MAATIFAGHEGYVALYDYALDALRVLAHKETWSPTPGPSAELSLVAQVDNDVTVSADVANADTVLLEWGDGGTVDFGGRLSHLYEETGTFTITLPATSDVGEASDTLDVEVDAITVFPAPPPVDYTRSVGYSEAEPLINPDLPRGWKPTKHQPNPLAVTG